MPVADVVSSFCVHHHQYADVFQLYIAINRDHIRKKLDLLRDCTAAVNDWFLSNGLSLNPDKSEVHLLGTTTKLQILEAVGQISVPGVLIYFQNSIKNLGVLLDTELTFNKHVVKVFQSTYFHVMALIWKRGALSSEIANSIVYAIEGGSLDYCNSILYGMSKNNISRLQHAQNTLARIITGTKKFNHVTAELPIQQTIEYKVEM